MSLPSPDPSYHISAAARMRLQPGVDPEALERLLQYFPPEARASHLEMFSIAHVEVDRDGRAPGDTTTLVRISDPVLQQLLEEVWQPYWAAVPDTELSSRGGPPGRELAQRRRGQGPQG
jgi:hypothetical protein